MFAALKTFNMLKMRYGIEIEAVMTDNGAEFGSGPHAKNKEEHPFERLLMEMQIKHRNIITCRYIYDQDESEFEDEELDIGSDDVLYWDWENKTWNVNIWAITQYLFDELPKIGRFYDLQISLRSKKLGDKFIRVLPRTS